MESYCGDGRCKQRVVANLGRKDLLAPHLNSLVRLLGGKGGESSWIRTSQVNPHEAACWGPVLAARALWQELGLDDILDDCEGQRRTQHVSLDELLKNKEEIEQALYFKLRDLFSLEAELVFYDLTSVYFEGEGPEELTGQECPAKTGGEEAPKTLVQEVAGEGPGVRVFVVHSEERLACERRMREQSIRSSGGLQGTE